ncbi:MAG: AAA family ATPase [Candidatus Limiplasma sp.]|nr:AAA family ATPase [Candidatus Limiplasma sp.]
MEQDELQQEKQHLAQTLAIIGRQLDTAAQESVRYAQIIRAIQEERMESNQMDVGGLYSFQGFADLAELSQGTHSLTQMTSAQENTGESIRTLLRMGENPYFARIDFRFADGKTQPIYIGRATLMEKSPMKIHIYDWRVPIASVFYQYGLGPAKYEAPAGTVEGEVLLKRQYEIHHGELLYYFDSNEQVMDHFLRELLSQPASASMKSIVETIQRDQDRIIRDMKAELLMVQGSAGSGKTSVALHRVAYLMYQGLQKDRLSPNEILVLAPNATFERYISQVLPDLGEKQVQTLLLEELLANLLPGLKIEPRSAWVEAFLTEPPGEEKDRMRFSRSFKGSGAFLTLLERWVRELPQKWIPFCDVQYDGRQVANAQWCRVCVCNSVKNIPLGLRLRRLEKALWERIHPLVPARYEQLLEFTRRCPQHALEAQPYARMLSIRESGRLLAQIRAFTRLDCAALYRGLFSNREAFGRLAAGLLPQRDIEPLRLATLERLMGNALPYEDAAAIAYLEARVNGPKAHTSLRQVVVDEAQDLDALHAALLKLLFPKARFTLLGDVQQTLAGPAGLSLYDDMNNAFGKANSLLVTLDKSFRCTREIWAFSARFLPPGTAGECFSRSGEKPSLHSAANEKELDALLLQHARQCLQAGHRSVALLCKTQRDAKALYQRLKGEPRVVLVGTEGALQNDRISILSLYTAKGLEFDAALLYGVDAGRYGGPEDRSLLYIGCTRALHVLRLFYTGTKSPLLAAETEVAG